MPVISNSLKGGKEVAAEISAYFSKFSKAEKNENGYYEYRQTNSGNWTVKTQSGDFMPEVAVKL